MKRIIGIDMARAIAVIGMIIVNFKTVFGTQGTDWLKTIASIFDGKAAAIFVVLAGVGLALMTNTAYKNKDKQRLKTRKIQIAKRALLLFIIGLSYISIWPADILHFYGIYMLTCLLFIPLKPKYILYAVCLSITLFPLLLIGFNYETGWDFNTLTYLDLWTVNGFIRHMFFNGFHPVIPWSAFMLFGLWLGRQDLKNPLYLKRLLKISSITWICIQIVSKSLLSVLTTDELNTLSPLFGTDPMPPLPLYMLNGISVATLIITSCILIAERYKQTLFIQALYKTGQLALTFYVAHVIIGMGVIEWFGWIPFGEYSIAFSFIYALLFSLLCILFSVYWLKYKTYGPLEWIMKKLNK